MDNKVGFYGFTVLNNKMIFSDVFTGRIVEYDIKDTSYNVKCLSFSLNVSGKMQYGVTRVVNNKVFFVPRNATNILIYDIEKDDFEKIELKCLGSKYGKPLFVDMVKIDNRLFFIPGRYPAVAELDLNSYVITLHEIGDGINLFTDCPVLFDDRYIYSFLNQNNRLCIFDTNDYSFKEIPLQTPEMKALAALEFGGEIIISGFGDRVLIIDKKTFELDFIDTYSEGEKPEVGIGKMVIYNGDIFGIAINQPVIYRIDIKEKIIQKFREFSWNDATKEIWEKLTKGDVLFADMIDDTLVFYSSMRNSIIEYNFKNDSFIYHDEPKWKNKADYIKEIRKNTPLLKEGIVSLSDFIEII